jgi:NADPH:quinone reductase-like Zn-dependent oxidoreductase
MTITDILTDKVLVKSVKTATIQPDGAQLARIGRLIDQGEIKAHVGPIFPLTAAKLACARARHGLRRGKVALRVIDQYTN